MRDIKIILLLIQSSVLMIISCMQKMEEPDYCEMISLDQSYVNNNKKDTIQYEADKKKRIEIFENNYNILKQYSKIYGFPKIDIEAYPEDSCKYWAVSMTLIHIAQSKPDVFYSDSNIQFLKKEIDNNRINIDILKRTLLISLKTVDFCLDQKQQVRTAIIHWEIEKHIDIEMGNFKRCD